LEPSLCVVSSWVIKRVYTILVWNTISGSSNLDICFYQCLILTLILHLKVLPNLLLLLLLLLFIISIVNLPVVWPRSCRVIYYFNTPTLGRKHQYFSRVPWVTLHSFNTRNKLRPLHDQNQFHYFVPSSKPSSLCLASQF
jgi:hypothetical protein